MEQRKEKIWFTSDIHFGHQSMLKYGRGACFVSVTDMDNWIVEQWNKQVAKDDTVYVLGDVSFRNRIRTAELLSSLNGRLHLILGNHDYGMASSNRRRFESVDHFKYLKVGEQRIALSHYPMRSWVNMHHGAWHLHGHTHGNVRPYGRSVDVGFDSPWITGAPTYLPVSYAEVERFMGTRVFESEDHHQEDV